MIQLRYRNKSDTLTFVIFIDGGVLEITLSCLAWSYFSLLESRCTLVLSNFCTGNGAFIFVVLTADDLAHNQMP